MTTEIAQSDKYSFVEQNCPICEIAPTKRMGMRGGQYHRLRSGIESEIWTCGECGLIFPNPMPIPVGGLGQHYNEDPDEYFINHDKESKSQNARDLMKKAENLLGRKGRLLDIGVGRGEVIATARDLGWEVEGIEPSQQFVQYVHDLYGLKVINGTFEDSDLPDNHYDIVILSAVLEHVYEPDLVIRKIANILKKGGLVFLDVPNERGLYFTIGNLYQKIRSRDWCINLAPTFSPFHLFGFSPRSLRKLLSKYELVPVDWQVYGGDSCVSNRGGFVGFSEKLASDIVVKLSNLCQMGTYIDTWAIKK